MLKANQLKITTVMDGTVSVIDNMTGGRKLLSQWGFSVLIEAGNKAFLLDVGTGSEIMNNVQVLISILVWPRFSDYPEQLLRFSH